MRVTDKRMLDAIKKNGGAVYLAARELNVRLNKNVAEWDFDTLANEFELDDLLDWGFDKGELDLEKQVKELTERLDAMNGSGDDD